MIKNIPLLSFFLLVLATAAFAQPINDLCDNAIQLPADISAYCSNNGEFTNVEATEGNLGFPTCWSNNNNDVWFSFIAMATDITITVNGNSGVAAGGTLNAPQIALYSTACTGTAIEIGCESDNTSEGIIQLYEGGLIIGATYWIRIDGTNNAVGTFQLCLNNYNPPVEPGSDCPDAAVLCDKSSFVVQSVTGAGADNTEMSDAPCFGGNFVETNSTWFSWVCETSGTLEFTLTPTNPIDDLDFVLYELPNGINDCSGKILRRCMAAGESPSNYPSPCHGPTGLSSNAVDFTENSGCFQGQDNFIAPYQMEAGKVYTLVVNNYTSTGNGFEVEFGGTGTFTGPKAIINSNAVDNTVCFSENIVFTDASTYDLGNIVDRNWSFSQDATPNTATGVGPHNVSFTDAGLKPVVLTLTTDKGCVVTQIEYFQVDSCCTTLNAVNVNDALTHLDCAHEFDGAIDLSPQGALQPYSYLWSNSLTTEDISGLAAGDYIVTITNDLGCQKVEGYQVNSPPLINPTPVIVKPTCNGGQDGSITLQTTGGVPPYEYNWQNTGFTTVNNITNIPIGTYNVLVRDAVGCTLPYNIEVEELVLALDPSIESVVTPTCNGDSDGSINVIINNGLGPYMYDWNDGDGFVNDNIKSNLSAGNYIVDVIDANNCIGTFNFDIVDYPSILLTPSSVDASCFGEEDGLATIQASGGLPGYTYLWDNGLTTKEIDELPAGDYTVSVTDNNGCLTTENFTITQPNEVFADAQNIIDVLCFGDNSGALDVVGSGGTPGYTFSLDGINYQDSVQFNDLNAGVQTLFVKDTMGCVGTGEAIINQPLPLLVSAGNDITIKLGYEASLNAIISPAGTNVIFSWSPTTGIIDTCGAFDVCDKITVKPKVTTTYTLTATDDKGCTALDKITVNVIPERPIFIPTGFTPNNDGENDFFTVFGGVAANRVKKMEVFDRWGALVFSGEDFLLNSEIDGWDGRTNGKEMSPGVYIYYVEIEFFDDEVIIYKGDITLLR